MSGRDENTRIALAYQEHRHYLVDLAFRMLGDIGAAEDAVQEAFARLLAARLETVEDERGWLIVVTSRVCLDRIKSAPARKEHAHDATDIEYVDPAAPQQTQHTVSADPADRVTLDDRISLAMLTLLRQLNPAERVTFVLHDIFQLPFTEVAATVGRTPAACRQLAKRARAKITEGTITEGAADARFDVPASEHRAVTQQFIAACATGNLTGLLEILAPDAWGVIDLGPDVVVPEPARGAHAVAANLLRFWGPPATLVSRPAAGHGQPALLGFHDRRLTGVLLLDVQGGLIRQVRVLGAPRLLDALSLQLTEPVHPKG
jgi:RNA polymerase sigma-70 factor (ECF subfamily)